MPRPKFESRLQVWIPTTMADAFARLADADGMFSMSDHLRMALANYLRAAGIKHNGPAEPRQANGQHEEHVNNGL